MEVQKELVDDQGEGQERERETEADQTGSDQKKNNQHKTQSARISKKQARRMLLTVLVL